LNGNQSAFMDTIITIKKSAKRENKSAS